MPIEPRGAGLTYGARLRQYQRRSSMVLWVGAALAGLIGLVTSGLDEGAPGALRAAAASLILLGLALLAIARIQFEWAGTELERAIQDGIDGKLNLPEDHRWPKLGEVAWLAGLICTPAAALVYFVAIWWAVA